MSVLAWALWSSPSKRSSCLQEMFPPSQYFRNEEIEDKNQSPIQHRLRHEMIM